MFEELIEKYTDFINQYKLMLRVKVFGRNNENLEFIMDSFYKLEPDKRNLVLFGIATIVTSLVFGCVFLYLVQVSTLERNLDKSIMALSNLKKYKIEEYTESSKFNSLLEVLKAKTGKLNFKPFFEKNFKTKKGRNKKY